MYIRDTTNPGQLKKWLDWIYRQVANNSGFFTLTANATKTVVQHNKCTAQSVVILTSQSANAASALSSLYVTAADGSFTVNHASTATTDRKLGYVIIGV